MDDNFLSLHVLSPPTSVPPVGVWGVSMMWTVVNEDKMDDTKIEWEEPSHKGSRRGKRHGICWSLSFLPVSLLSPNHVLGLDRLVETAEWHWVIDTERDACPEGMMMIHLSLHSTRLNGCPSSLRPKAGDHWLIIDWPEGRAGTHRRWDYYQIAKDYSILYFFICH